MKTPTELLKVTYCPCTNK